MILCFLFSVCLQSEGDTSVDGEERTPGRLQAVWPPPREEKVGLKYTEAGTARALPQRSHTHTYTHTHTHTQISLTHTTVSSREAVGRVENI